MKRQPLNCCECGRFIGKDGFPDVFYTDEGWEEGYSYCKTCGEKRGMKRNKEEA